jgi:hypothetical protein
MVAATGVTTIWLIDTSGDWMHLLPGVTAIAITAAAVLCRDWGGQLQRIDPVTGVEPQSEGRLRTLAGTAGLAFVLAVGGASLLRAGLTQLYLDDARAELSPRPSEAIQDASRALRLDAANLDAYYVKAAALARFDRAQASEQTLLSAARQDPGNFVTWTLLGDLEVRRYDFAGAKRFYSRAYALDPQDSALAALSADPASALSGSPNR